MLDTIKRAILPFAALAITVPALLLALTHSPHWLWLLVLTVPVLALGLYDWFQRDWTITRN